MKYVLGRLKEPSTWAGLSMLATAFGMPALLLPAFVKVGAAVAAVLAVTIREGV